MAEGVLNKDFGVKGRGRRPYIRRSLADRVVGVIAAGPPGWSLSDLGWRRLVRVAGMAALDGAAVLATLGLTLLAAGRPMFTTTASLGVFLVMFAVVATASFFLMGLYYRSWRFLNFSDCVLLVVSTLMALGIAWLGSLSAPQVRGQGLILLPIALQHWVMLTFVMGAMRMLRRGLWELVNRKRRRLAARDTDQLEKVLLIGPPHWARTVINVLRSDTVSTAVVVGVLLPDVRETMDRLSSVPVLGTHEAFGEAIHELESKNLRPDRVIAHDDGNLLSHRDMSRLIHSARELKLNVTRVRDSFAGLLQRGGKGLAEDPPIRELLGRSEFTLESEHITRQVMGRCILVTGAGGTIGGELCRQLAGFRPSRLVLLEHSEYALYAIEMALREQFPELDIRAELCSVRRREDVRRAFAEHRPSIVYHAAALKHVPIVEANPCAGVHTNIIGTRIVADAVCEYGARAMVQVSTDKAVNPVGLMGATKRVGELYSQALDLCGVDDPEAPRFMTVRFGNVLGSSGSIVPLFMRQLREGKPLTVTHPDIERYFMTVSEAVQLILQSSASALEQDSRRGTIFVLDMGDPVRIVDLARRMILLYGLEPDIDVPIRFVGLRAGEKLYEELFDNCEERVDSHNKGIFEASSKPIPLALITRAIDRLVEMVRDGDAEESRRITHLLANLPSSGGKLDFLPPRQFVGQSVTRLAVEGAR